MIKIVKVQFKGILTFYRTPINPLINTVRDSEVYIHNIEGDLRMAGKEIILKNIKLSIVDIPRKVTPLFLAKLTHHS